MRILWVEDTRNDTQREEFFSPVLGRHEVDLIVDFTIAERSIANQLHRYDWFVLDINLENSETTERVQELVLKLNQTSSEFLNQAGMKLFLDLLQAGVPEERIVFLTGNTDGDKAQSYWVREIRKAWPRDQERLERAVIQLSRTLSDSDQENFHRIWEEAVKKKNFSILNQFLKHLEVSSERTNTYEQFEELFTRALLEPSQAYPKEPLDKFHWWLKHTLLDQVEPFLSLRRGVLDALTYWRERLQTDPTPRFLFNECLPEDSSEVMTWGWLDYLDLLSSILPLQKPNNSEEEQRILRLFLLSLSHPWDKALPWRVKGNPLRQNMSWIAKFTRNWLAHGNLQRFDVADVAFVFCCVLRATFETEETPLPYELELLRLFSTQISEEDWQAKIRGEFKSELQRQFRQPFREMMNDPHKIFTEFTDALRFRTQDQKREAQMRWLYLLFWDSFFDTKLTKPNTDLPEFVLMSLTLNLRSTRLPIEGSLARELARAVWRKSFFT